MSIASFVAQFLPQAQSVSAQTGLPVDYILGQAGVESAWGTSNLAVNSNNFFGIGGPGNFQSYSSPDAGFGAYASLMGTSRYSGINTTGSAYDIASSQVAAGYTSDPGYAGVIQSAVASVDNVLTGSGVATGAVAPGTTATTGATGTASGAAASTSPSGWIGAIEGAAANLAGRIGVFVLAIILLLGAVVLFALRTQTQSTQPG